VWATSTAILVLLGLSVTGHLSEGSFVRNIVVQIPTFDAKPNPKPNPGLTLTPALTLTLALTITLYFSDK